MNALFLWKKSLQHLPRGTEENRDKIRSVPWTHPPRIKLSISQEQRKNSNHKKVTSNFNHVYWIMDNWRMFIPPYNKIRACCLYCGLFVCKFCNLKLGLIIIFHIFVRFLEKITNFVIIKNCEESRRWSMQRWHADLLFQSINYT